jgi:hypothetical protein
MCRLSFIFGGGMSWKEHFWPIKTGITFFDKWSVVHLTGWFTLGANLQAIYLGFWVSFVILLLTAFGWEILERTLLKKKIEHPESWLNSWVSDPIVDMIGGLLGIWFVLTIQGFA